MLARGVGLTGGWLLSFLGSVGRFPPVLVEQSCCRVGTGVGCREWNVLGKSLGLFLWKGVRIRLHCTHVTRGLTPP